SKISTRTLLFVASCMCGGFVAVAIGAPLSVSLPRVLRCGRSVQASFLPARGFLPALFASRPSRGACSQLLLHVPQVARGGIVHRVRQSHAPHGMTCIAQ